MKTLYLYGNLAEEFGDSFRMDVASPVEAFRLMDVNFPGKFRKAIENKTFDVFCGDRQIGQDEFFMCSGRGEIHVRPVLQGAKGVLAIPFGFPLLGSIFPAGGFLGALGGGAAAGGAFGGLGSMLLGVAIVGIGALLSNALRPKEPKDRENKEKPSFIFDGPVNVTEQGGPIPLVYGRVRVGSISVSAGLRVEKV